MVRVASCVMGTGKSSAAITYINEHSDTKFIYITPYLDEAARIHDGCPDADFVEPSNKIEKHNYLKGNHTAELIHEGRNIATTHQSFIGYTPAMLEEVSEQGYTLIIDESVDVLESYTIHPDDLNLAVAAGIVKEDDGVYTMTDKPYNGKMLHELLRTMRSRELIRVNDRLDNVFFYWTLSPDLITSFKDVFILTYLFEGQSLHHLLEIYHIPYEMIGIEQDEEGTYRFCEYPGMTPAYVYQLKDKIHILENDKLNSIGDDYYALSENWYRRDPAGAAQAKQNLYNFFRNVCGQIPASDRLWGAYKDTRSKLSGKGYTSRYLAFNARATNEFRNCTVVGYMCNVFMHPAEYKFYTAHGIEVDQNLYALSVISQFVFRSAIRDGHDIQVYIPSSRMRGIFTDWVNSFSRPMAGTNTCGETSSPVQEGGVASES